MHAVEAIADPTEKPAGGSKLQMVQWALMLPLQLIMKVTIPGEKSIAKFNMERHSCELLNVNSHLISIMLMTHKWRVA